MLIGLVIIGSFGTLYFVNNVVNKIKFNQKIEKIMNDLVQRTPMNLYVTECIEKSFVEGLDLLGKQGGMIYSDQDGSLLPRWGLTDGTAEEDDIYYVEYEGDKINHAILDDVPPAEEYKSDTPQYPCRMKFKAGDAPSDLNILCKELETRLTNDNPCYFMHNIYMHPLNYKQALLADACSIPLGKVNTPPLYKNDEIGSTLNISIQRQLENYIANKTKSCVNFTSISKAVGYEIYAGDVNATVSFSDEEIFTNLKFPVIIAVKGRPPVTKFLDFRSDKDIRLKVMYEALTEAGACRNIQHLDIHPNFKGKNLLTIDNLDLKFDLESNISGCLIKGTNSIIDLGIDVEKIDADPFDVFVLTDNDFQLQGNPYVFQFARQNRYPSLDYMTNYLNYKTSGRFGQYAYSYGTDPQRYFDFMVPVGSTIDLKPHALDPDGDDIFFRFMGWREDTYSYWDPDLGTPDECSLDPYLCVAVGPPANPHNWTNSNPSWNLNGEVSIVTNGSDVGAHEVTVEVYDSQTVSFDRQTLRILVYQWIIPAPMGGHGYDDITDPMKASVEDPYYMDASASETEVCPDKAFDWHDVYENTLILPHYSFIGLPPPGYFVVGHKLYSGEESFVAIFKDPCPGTACTFDIKDPTGAFETVAGPPDDPAAHTIQLTVKDISCSQQVASETMDVTVYECLAHQYPSAPYPFCSTSEAENFDTSIYKNCADNYFYGNHSCCQPFASVVHEGGGKLFTAAQAQDCFDFAAYTCKPETEKEQYPGTLAIEESVASPPAILKTADMTDAIIDNSQILNTPDGFGSMNTRFTVGVRYPSDLRDSDNDIYKHIFTQKCSGNRGNACSGVFEEKFMWELGCNDIDINTGQDERCQGPCTGAGCVYDPNPANPDSCPQQRTDMAASCYQYTNGQSFELTYVNNGIPGNQAGAVLQNEPGVYIDGACINLWKQSKNTGYGGFNFKLPPTPPGTKAGDYLCQAGCGFSECTNAVHCRLVDDYDGNIPLSDKPGIEGYQVGNNIYGYPLEEAPNMRGTPFDYTKIPTNYKDQFMLPDPYNDWCDGECFARSYNIANPSPIQGPLDPNFNLWGYDQCMARDYSIVSISSDSLQDGITFVGVDIDTSSAWCGECSYQIDTNNVDWLTSGEELNPQPGEYITFEEERCCGDDASEYPTDELYYGVPGDGSAQKACCSSSTDCVENDDYGKTRCYTSAPAGMCTNENCLDTDNNNDDKEICFESEWHDCDESSSLCQKCRNPATSGPPTWDLDGSVNEGRDDYDFSYTDDLCCGDDNNEYFLIRNGVAPNNPGDDACCDVGNDCVYKERCYASDDDGINTIYNSNACTALQPENTADADEFYCVYGQWNNDADNNADVCACLEDDPLNKCTNTECFEPSGDSGIFGSYNGIGDTGCCGDDIGEVFQRCSVTYTSSSAVCDSNSDNQKACCNNQNDCIDRVGECVSEGANEFDALFPTGPAVPSARNGYCEAGQWVDPDLDSGRCSAVGNIWFDTGYCCGDDYNSGDTNYLESWGGQSANPSFDTCCCNGGLINDGALCIDKPGDPTYCVDGILVDEISDGDLDGDLQNPPYQDGCPAANDPYLACDFLNQDFEPDGICVHDRLGGIDCLPEVVLASDNEYYSECSAPDNGRTCDTDVRVDGGVTPPYQAKFFADGLCVSDSGNPTCDIDEICEDGVLKAGCDQCIGGSLCDDKFFDPSGVCYTKDTGFAGDDECCVGAGKIAVGTDINDALPEEFCKIVGESATLGSPCDVDFSDGLVSSGLGAGKWTSQNSGSCCFSGFGIGSAENDGTPFEGCLMTCDIGKTCLREAALKYWPGVFQNDIGICVYDATSTEVCQRGFTTTSFDGITDYYNYCKESGFVCDTRVSNPGFGFEKNGICIDDVTLQCLDNVPVCDDGSGSYYASCLDCGDAAECDSSIAATAAPWFIRDGYCQDSQCCSDVIPIAQVDCNLDAQCISGDCESCKCECDENSECPANYFCNTAERCVPTLIDGASCSGVTNTHTAIEEDGACQNNCDDSEGKCISCSADGIQNSDGSCEEECDLTNSVHARCDEILPFNLQNAIVRGWCYGGANGCTDFCITQIVDDDVPVPNLVLSSGDTCGCDDPADDGKDCDPYVNGFDGSYDGDVCNTGVCW